MKHTLKHYTAWLLIMAMLLAMLPAAAGAEQAEALPVPCPETLSLAPQAEGETCALYLGGDKIIHKGAADGEAVTVAGISYEEEGSFWKLENVCLDGACGTVTHGEENVSCLLEAEEGQTLKISGVNRFSMEGDGEDTACALYLGSGCTLSGDGILQADCTPGSRGIYADGDLTIDGPTVEAAGLSVKNTLTLTSGDLTAWCNGTEDTLCGVKADTICVKGGSLQGGREAAGTGISAAHITVEGGSVKAVGETAISASEDFTATDAAILGGETPTAMPEPGEIGISEEKYTVLLNTQPVQLGLIYFTPVLTVAGTGTAYYSAEAQTVKYSVENYGFEAPCPAFNPSFKSWDEPAAITGTMDETLSELTVTIPAGTAPGLYAMTVSAPVEEGEAPKTVKKNLVLQVLPNRSTGLNFAGEGLQYRNTKGETVTVNPLAASITDSGEGWAWYCSKQGKYSGRTLVLRDIWLETEDRQPIQLPEGATVYVEGGESRILSNYSGEDYAYGICGWGSYTIAGRGDLTVVSGHSGEKNSYAVYAYKNLILQLCGVLTAEAGTSAGSGAMGWSTGICAVKGNITMQCGNIKAIAKDSGYSFALYSEGATTVNGGRLEATSGEGTVQSRGIYVKGAMTVTGADIRAKAETTMASKLSTGIRADSLTANGSAVTAVAGKAKGTSNGLWTSNAIYFSGDSYASVSSDEVETEDDNATLGSSSSTITYGKFMSGTTGITEEYGSKVMRQTDLAVPIVLGCDYGLYLGSDHVLHKNNADGEEISVDGISYSSEDDTWTVKDLQLATTGGAVTRDTTTTACALAVAEGENIRISGTNALTLAGEQLTPAAAILLCGAENTLTGSGTLQGRTVGRITEKDSFGIYAAGSLTAEAVTLNAFAGDTAGGCSAGIKAEGDITLKSLTATAGSNGGEESCGISGRAFSAVGSTVKVNGGSAGSVSNGLRTENGISLDINSTLSAAAGELYGEGDDNAIRSTDGVITAAGMEALNAAETFLSGTTSSLHKIASGEYLILSKKTEQEQEETQEKDSTSSSSSAAASVSTVTEQTSYSVTLQQPTGGKLTSSVSSGYAGATVTVTVTPDTGYTLEKLTVTKANGATVTTTKKLDNVYTFIIPSGNTTVTAAMKKTAQEEAAAEEKTATEEKTETKKTFTDIKTTDWFVSDVEYVVGQKLFTGTTAEKFGPEEPMSREMLWTVLGRLAGNTLTGKTVFADAKKWAVEKGLSDGTNPKSFVTREQLAVLLYRYAVSAKEDGGKSSALSAFPDAGEVSSYATAGISWAVGAGILQGSHGLIKPQGTATRAQVAAMIHRYCTMGGK